MQSHVWRRQFVVSADRLLATPSRASDAAPQVVGFADVVGFSDISRGLDERELADFIQDFEARAISVITAGDGRVIKTLGDGILFEADHPLHGARIGLTLAGQHSNLDDRPNLHVGLAYGPVLHQHGDIFGTVVNLASRLASLARPGTVLIDDAFAAQLHPPKAAAEGMGDAGQFVVRALRAVSVRGFEHLQPWLLRAEARASTLVSSQEVATEAAVSRAQSHGDPGGDQAGVEDRGEPGDRVEPGLRGQDTSAGHHRADREGE